MEQKIKILQVFTQMGRGGAETMIMNYYRQLDRQKYQFDFLVHRKQRCDYDNEIEQMGGTIFRAFPIRPWNYFLYFNFLDSFFREHAEQYTAVHAHIQENSGIVLRYAAKYGIKNRVCTSHIANLGIDYKYPFRLYGKTYNKYITKRLACGKEAGKYLYGNKNFEVFPNAINLIDFKYNFKQDIAFRENNKWMGKFIVENVARFSYQKNHTFLIDIFNEIYKLNKNAILVLVGEGELKPYIMNKVISLNLSEVVYFEGLKTNINDYMNVFDVFLLPSLFEGLPVVAIEAQAAGIKSFLSDTIDIQTDITGDVTFISLNYTAFQWANCILSNVPYVKKNNYIPMKLAGYDVKTNIDKLVKLYTDKIY